MRRIEASETLHGTRDGQLAVDEALAERFGFSERESICAALLKSGRTAQDISDRLGVSISTVEKHLVSVRRKLGVSTTLQAAVMLLRDEDDSTARIPRAFGAVLPVSPRHDGGSAHDEDSALYGRLCAASTVAEMLDLLREDLGDQGVRALFYAYLPLAAASFRKGYILQQASAPKSLLDALRGDRGQLQGHAARLHFAEPDRAVSFRLDGERDGKVPLSTALAEACRRAGVRVGLSVGSPFGAGYVVLTAFCTESGQTAAERASQANEGGLRERLLLLQNLAFSFGALARTADLTRRERDVLALIAAGHTTASAAQHAACSERALGQLLRSARAKLNADTTAEAVAHAMAINALVFL